ncbi:AAA family ATPase [Acidobacteria bacterium AH-259-O06]|nr:AAA family ATPase [Acidobacteria bacterium AH-259-O06]
MGELTSHEIITFLERHIKFARDQTGAERKAHCPRPELHANGDRTPSLSVNVDKGLLKCFVCGLEGHVSQVAKKLGWPALSSDNHQRRNGLPETFKNQRIVAWYTYTNEHGRPIFKVARTSAKEFPVWAPVIGDGSWGLKGKGVRMVPYHLHKLVKAEFVSVVEGEKDVQTVESMGLAASTFPGGAPGNWRPEYSKWFKGKEIVIIPDNDKPGREHADVIGTGLFAHAKSVRILNLPGLAEKGDVSDWAKGKDPVEAGEELCKLADGAPRFRPPSKTIFLSEVKTEPVLFLWHPYLLRRKVNLIEGDPGLGKSYLSLALAAPLSLGKALPGSAEQFAPQRTLILSAEDGVADTIKPRLESMGADLELISAWAAASEKERQYWKPLTLDDGGFEELDREMCKLSPALVILDPLFAFIGEKRDINAANHTRAVMARLANLAEKHDSCIVCIRHLTKGNRGKSIYRGIGSIDLTAAARSVLLIGKNPGIPEPFVTKSVLLHIKHNLTGQGQTLGFEIREGLFYWTGQSEATAGEILAPEPSPEELSAIEEALRFLKEALADGPVKSTSLDSQRRSLGISERTLLRAKKQLGVKAFRREDGWYCSL